MRRIGIVTGGGDAPGMNVAIRAAVRTACHPGVRVFAIHHGSQGMLDRDGRDLSPRDVSNIGQQGGTVLHTAGCDTFHRPDGQEAASEALWEWEIDGLVAINTVWEVADLH